MATDFDDLLFDTFELLDYENVSGRGRGVLGAGGGGFLFLSFPPLRVFSGGRDPRSRPCHGRVGRPPSSRSSTTVLECLTVAFLARTRYLSQALPGVQHVHTPE